MTKQRRNFSAEMKARIAVEAIKSQKTIQEIAGHYGVHPFVSFSRRTYDFYSINRLLFDILDNSRALR